MKYSRTALGLLNAQYRSVLRKCFLINAGLFALGAIAATPANADETNKYDMVDGASIVLTGNESITNTIDTEVADGAGRKTAILASGKTSINTGDYTLTVNSSGATGRNYIFNTTTEGTDFTFTGNLDGIVTSTGSVQGRGLRINSSSDVVYDGSIKVTVKTENVDAYGTDMWPSSAEGASATFSGALTDITAKSTGSQAFGVYANLSDGGTSEYNFNADKTKIATEANSSSGTATAAWIAYSDISFNGDTELSAKNSIGTSSGLRVLSDTNYPKSTAYLNGDNISINIDDSVYGWGVLASGNSEVNSKSENLEVNVNTSSTDNVSVFGMKAQYGGQINLQEGSNTKVKVTTESGWSDGISAGLYAGLPGSITSKGTLEIEANGRIANGIRITNGSSFEADSLTAKANGTTQAFGAWVSDSDVVIGSEGKTSSLIGTASENGFGAGIYMTESEDATTSTTLKGTITTNGSHVGVYVGDGTLNNEADLTIVNGMFNGGTFNTTNNLTVEDGIYNSGVMNLAGTEDIVTNIGGIDGDAESKGKVNVTGAGEVLIANSLKNQIVKVDSELHLDAADVSGSTINLGSDAVLNTINNAIDDYSSIQLADNSNIKVDANLGLGQMDLFSAKYGHDTVDLNVVEANMIGTSDEEVLMQLVNNGVKVNTSSVIYNWDEDAQKHTKTGIVGSGSADGKVKVSNGATVSNLEVAARDTSSAVKESVVYEMGESENFGTETVENATFVVEGNNQSVNVSGSFGVDNKSVVTINDATFNGEGSIDTAGKLKINDSNINVDVNIAAGATLESDPTTYTATVTNAGTASFDGDTFTSTAELRNSGTANFIDITFEQDSKINGNGGTGTLNFNGGTNKIGAVVTDNNLNLNNGSSIVLTEGSNMDGLALTTDANNGTIDMRNKRIDTLGSTSLGSDLNVLMDLDLNADKSDTLGTITNNGYGLNLNALELLALGGDEEHVQIATAGTDVALSSDVTNTLKTYYTNVDYSSADGKLNLTGKQQYASADLVGTWGTENYIKAYSAADAAGTSVGANLTILDEQVKTNEDDIADINTAITVAADGNYISAGTEVANNLTALDTAVSGKQNALTAGSGIDITSDTISIKSNSITHDMIKEAEVYKSNLSLGVQNEINQGVSADTRVGKQTTAYSGGALDGKTIGAGDTSTDITVVSALGTLNGAIADKTLTVDTTTGIATIKDGTTTADVYTKEAAEAIFTEKQKWVDNTLGIVSANADAVKEQYEGTNYLADATTLTGADKLLDAAIATKQDKLIAGQGIAIAADEKTISVKLADTTTSKSGLQLSDDGLSVKVGDSLAISNTGYVDIKANSSQFEITSATGLNLADNAVTSSKIASGAVTFDKLASDAVATSITGAANKIATDAAVQSYVDGAIGNAITFNSDNTVTLTVAPDSANIYDTTGTANYVKANAQNADYTATSGAVDLTSNSSIAQALQTLDSAKASLAKDNTFTGANTFKSDSGITVQNKTTPAISSNLVATQLTVGTEAHDVLQLTVSDSTGKGSALYVKDADVVTNGGFMALDASGTDRFSADEDGIELKKASGATTFSVDSATGNTAVAGTMDIEGDTTIGDKFSVTAADGSISATGGLFTVHDNGYVDAAGGKFKVGQGGSISATKGLFTVHDNGYVDAAGGKFQVAEGGSISASNGNFTVDADGNVTAAGTMDIEGDTTIGGTLDVTGLASLDGGINVNEKFSVDTNGNTTVLGNLGVSGASFLKDTTVDGGLGVTGNATVAQNLGVGGTAFLNAASVTNDLGVGGNATVAKNFSVGGTSFLKDTTVDGGLGVTGNATVVGTAKVGALTFNGTDKVNAIDTGAAAITDGDATTTARKETMATTATVAKTIGNLAKLENTHGVTSVADVASAINSLATNVETATGGTFTNNVWKGTVTMAAKPDYTYNGATGHANIMAFVNDLASNIGAATTAANGNITSSKTVNANLDQLDGAIGNRSNLGSKNDAINTGTKTSVAAGLKAAGDAIGDMNFGQSHYVSAQNDLSGAVRTLDSNLYRVETDLRDLKRDFNRGMASMAAMSALVPNPRAHGNTSLAIGTGAYSGHTAAAIGGFHYLTDNIMLNAGVAWGNSSDASYRMGVTFSW